MHDGGLCHGFKLRFMVMIALRCEKLWENVFKVTPIAATIQLRTTI